MSRPDPLPLTVEEWHRAMCRAVRKVVDRATKDEERDEQKVLVAALADQVNDWLPAKRFLWVRPFFNTLKGSSDLGSVHGSLPTPGPAACGAGPQLCHTRAMLQ